MTLQELVQAYEAAWNATDGAERRRLLAQCFADEGVFAGEGYHFTGRETFAAVIDEFRQTYPAAHITLIDMREQHGVLLLRVHIAASSERQWSVIDVAERGDDGRLKRVNVFSDTVPNN